MYALLSTGRFHLSLLYLQIHNIDSSYAGHNVTLQYIKLDKEMDPKLCLYIRKKVCATYFKMLGLSMLKSWCVCVCVCVCILQCLIQCGNH